METGKDLLEYLQSLTPEQLELKVVLDGCDCSEDIGAAVISAAFDPPAYKHSEVIYLIRKDHA